MWIKIFPPLDVHIDSTPLLKRPSFPYRINYHKLDSSICWSISEHYSIGLFEDLCASSITVLIMVPL